MATRNQYPIMHHPCFSNNRENLWTRIHLPVAARCNVKCIFCDHNLGAACHTSKPGYSSHLMTPREAIARVITEHSLEPRLKIVAISGPGEPLANDETFVTLKGVHDNLAGVEFCLSTNGTLLVDTLEKICNLNISTISVSMSTQSYDIAAQLYEWAILDGQILKGKEMGREVISRQLNGIRFAADAGIFVKVNTILIPELNDDDIGPLSHRISDAGAQLQNIVPIVSCGKAINLKPPLDSELAVARRTASQYIDQFLHCKQCRSDVIGIPGKDRVL
ncbi:MAG: radical SAM protein [Candidatus Thorarchaeota archaeon]